MATKKQKRAAAMAKRDEFMAQIKAEGLAAQKSDKERRKEQGFLLAGIGIETGTDGIKKASREKQIEMDQDRAKKFVEALYIGGENEALENAFAGPDLESIRAALGNN